MPCYNACERHKLQVQTVNADPYLYDQFSASVVPPEGMDELWAAGWRHFGPRFFRYSLHFDPRAGWQVVQPLRIDLARFALSKSQRRVRNRNADVRWEIIPARADAEVQALFHEHKTRFTENVPESLFDFISAERPAVLPCECLEVRALLDERLVAASFLDVGRAAASSIYGVFDPELSRRSLGILTMLREIEYAMARGLRHYYPGYATRGSSVYDYKKRFRGLETLDWTTGTWNRC